MGDIIRAFPAKVDVDGRVSCFQCTECKSIFWLLEVSSPEPEDWHWYCAACGKSFNDQVDDLYV